MMIGTLAITGVGIPLTGWIRFRRVRLKGCDHRRGLCGGHWFAFWALVIAALIHVAFTPGG